MKWRLPANCFCRKGKGDHPGSVRTDSEGNYRDSVYGKSYGGGLPAKVY